MADFNWNLIVDTPEERNAVINDMQGLRAHPGWIRLQQILSAHIATIENDILNDENMPKDTEHDKKLERMDFILFRDLPGNLITDLMPHTPAQEFDTEDVYRPANHQPSENDTSIVA